MPKYVIEHLEPKVWKWCLIEYRHISQLVGKENLIFTNLKQGNKALEAYGQVVRKSVKELSLPRSCLLDPEAEKTLTPEEARQFEHFIFGGILGDDPPRKRTQQELTPFLPQAATRNIGKEQMSTDNAVYVVQQICLGTPLEKIPFQQEVEIAAGKDESAILPYKYALVSGRPLISKELVELLKRQKGF